MKKLALIATVSLIGCGKYDNDGAYVAHFESNYSVADDTLEIMHGIVTKSIGYNFIRDGKLKHRHYEVSQWRLNEPGTPILQFYAGELVIGKTHYKKIR